MPNLESLPFIKGAVGRDRLNRLAELGANAVRLPSVTRAGLDEAAAAGLGVLAGLPLKPERNGMDYGAVAAVREQRSRVMDIVKEFKDHPALLMWCVGNELDHIPGEERFDTRVWTAVNDIARDIHEVDSRHPSLTAVGMGRFGKVEDCARACPELDLLGINSYAGIEEVDSLLLKHGWNKPYVFTEWGMSGAWQRPKTEWKAPFEECGAAKSECYRRRWNRAVAAHPGRCLGGFAFYWGWRHETTMTWYNMRDSEQNEMETVSVMESLWKDREPEPDLPRLYGVRVNGFAAPDNVYLRPGERVELEALTDASAEAPGARLVWEPRPEVVYAAYAGHGEVLPEIVPGALLESNGSRAVLRAPDQKGRYRVFAHLYDGRGRFSTANMPFHVGELPEHER